MQNAPGAWANPPAKEAFGASVAALPLAAENDNADTDEAAFRRRVAFFRGQEPDEDEALPELEFWDAEKTLPKSVAPIDEGAVVIVYGPSGDFKTATCVSDALDAIARGAKVVFAEGEGTHGFRKQRLPAACRARGIATSSLRGKWRTCPAVPLLTDAVDVDAFIAAHRQFHPDIVYLDTLAAASGGTDENSAAFGQLLVSTGPVGRICRELRCTVVVIHHTGKDLSAGARGHSSVTGNADGAHFITADKDARTVNKYIQKMRDAADGFSIGYRVTPAEQTPVLTKTGRLDRQSEAAKLTAAQLANLRVMQIGEQLREFGAVGEAKAMTYRQFAELRCGRPRPPQDDAKEFTKWTLEVELDEKELRNWTTRAEAEAKRKKTPNPFARYCRRVVWPGAEKSILAWFAPEE
jgi:AAA domain